MTDKVVSNKVFFKSHAADLEKIIMKYRSDKELYPEYMEKLSLHNKKTSKGPIKKKMGRKCGHFTKGKIQMANKHMK